MVLLDSAEAHTGLASRYAEGWLLKVKEFR
jgi:hypothetical protein